MNYRQYMEVQNPGVNTMLSDPELATFLDFCQAKPS